MQLVNVLVKLCIGVPAESNLRAKSVLNVLYTQFLFSSCQIRKLINRLQSAELQRISHVVFTIHVAVLNIKKVCVIIYDAFPTIINVIHVNTIHNIHSSG